jgi:hypothetical protein
MEARGMLYLAILGVSITYGAYPRGCVDDGAKKNTSAGDIA